MLAEDNKVKIDGYNHFGGKSTDLGALRNVLDFYGLKAPHTGQPYTEEMLRGIGGGIGVIYFTFVFDEFHTMYIGTCDVRQSGKPSYIQTAVERIGGQVKIQETAGAKGAAANLRAAIEAGTPAITWLDLASLPYSGFPPELMKYYEHIAVVYGLEDGKAYIGDRAVTPLVVTEDELAQSRGAITSQKHRIITVQPPQGSPDLRAAIVSGINDCVRGMLHPAITNFGLKGLEKWADRLTNRKDKQGWPTVFPRGGYLLDALQAAYNYIELWGTGGKGSRGMYADFLSEAGAALESSGLEAVAGEYRHAADLWRDVAESALSDDVPLFLEVKELLTKRDSLFIEQGAATSAERLAISKHLAEIREQANENFPLSQSEIDDLLSDLRGKVSQLHDAEARAVNMLQTAVEGF